MTTYHSKEAHLNILKELQIAKDIHPVWPNDLIHQVSIVCEEAGEVLEEAHPYLYGNNNQKSMIEELTQTGAMVYRFLEYNGLSIDEIERAIDICDYSHKYKISEPVTIACTALRSLKATLDHVHHGKPYKDVICYIVRLGSCVVELLNRLTLDQ